MACLSAKDMARKEEYIQLVIEHFYKAEETSVHALAFKYKVSYSLLQDGLAGVHSFQESH
jgi:hypothetical protein